MQIIQTIQEMQEKMKESKSEHMAQVHKNISDESHSTRHTIPGALLANFKYTCKKATIFEKRMNDDNGNMGCVCVC